MDLLLAQAHPTIEEHIIRQERKPLIHFFNTTLYQRTRNYDGGYNISHLILDAYSERWRFFVNLSFAKGKGLNAYLEKKGFSLLPSADDIESQVENINLTGRKYLLEATLSYSGDHWEAVVGIVDATAFFDTNRYANDELSFFLNADLVNNPLALLPSYNPGMILSVNFNKFFYGRWGLVDASPDAEKVYLLQSGFSARDTDLEFYYFNSPDADFQGYGFSGSFVLREIGIFTRLGKNSLRDYAYFVSGGFVIGLKMGKLGIGYAYRKGRRRRDARVFEVFYRIPLNHFGHITLDYQYLYEKSPLSVFGIRLHFEY